MLAGQTPLFSVRPDIVGPYTAARLRDQVGEQLYPIPLNASLLAFVDPPAARAFERLPGALAPRVRRCPGQ